MLLNKVHYENIDIIYEDNHLLVAEKPVNMLSQQDISGDKDILTKLKEYIKVKYNKPGNVYLGLVHRLDRPVGGVMVFAKTSKAASRLSKQVRDRGFGKRYMAVVRGIPQIKSKEGLTHYLIKDRRRNMVATTQSGADGAQKAVLDYEVIGQASDMALVHIDLHTGRSHQIRVQLAALGHPLYGDQRYGRGINKPGQQIALWATEISLVHPTLREAMTFSSSPPHQYPWDMFGY
ncbi:MAG TPA: RluA family pseudouridine synthase [Clostridia bacterium]|nr:RluA family pseudouridine synthase [Clostridia bacterium]